MDEINGWTTKVICPECWSRVETFDLFHQEVYITHQKNIAGEETRVKKETDVNCAPYPTLFVEPFADEIEDDFPDLDEKSSEDTRIKSEWSDDKRAERTHVEEQPMVDEPKATESTETDNDEERNVELEKIVPQYFHMVCDLCGYKFDSWLTAKEHYLQQHNISRAYLKCCNKKYIMRGRILHHVSWHIDPNAFT